MNRNFILGIDGIPFDLMESLSSKGYMPNFEKLKQNFTFKRLQSSIPHISSVSWSSIITGKNPGEHGIYGFTDLIEGTYSLRYPNFNALKSEAFWHKRDNQKHIIVNVPFTYPAKKLNGIHIAGFVALDLDKAVYPKELIHELKAQQYQIDIDTSLAKKQSKREFFNELFRILEIRKKTYLNLWNQVDWINFLFVITGSDRLGHFFWNMYEDVSNKYHELFIKFFQKVDDIIGKIYSKLDKSDTFMIISDHGMESIEQNVNLNTYLEQEGILQLNDDLKRYNRVMGKSKAFVLDPGRVYLHKESKFPKGSVSKDQEEGIIEQLKEIFYNLRYDNEPVIRKVYEKEEIYKGKTIENAPDLVLIEEKGFRLKGSIGKKNLFEKDIFTGKHNQEAFLFINKDINIKEPKVENIVNLMED